MIAAKGLFLDVEIEKKGVDVVVTVSDPQGQPLVSADSPNGAFGTVAVSIISGQGGEYSIRVAKSPRSNETGRYRVQLKELQPPTDEDRARLQAETDFLAAVADDRAQDREKQLRAITRYQNAAALWRSLNDTGQEGLCWFRVGFIYRGLGEMQKALEAYNQALPLRHAAGDRAGEGATLNAIGVARWNLGENQKALDYYNQALTLRRAAGDRLGQAGSLGNLGVLYRGIGKNQRALAYFNEVLSLMRALGDRGGAAKTLNNMGGIYSDLGQNQKALALFNQALRLNRALGSRENQAGNWNNIGMMYTNLKKPREALDAYNQALPLWRSLGQPTGEAWTLQNLGELYWSLGDKQKALDYFNQALPLNRAAGDRATEAIILNNIAEAYAALGEKQRALSQYTEALLVAQAVSSPSSQALILGNLMRYWQADERPEAAIFFGKESVNQYQELRRSINGLDQKLQQSYLSTVTRTYRGLADLLIAQGRLSEAEQILSLMKEQEYFDYVRRDAAEASVGGRANLNSKETEWDAYYHEAAGKLAALANERVDLLAKDTRTPEESQRLDQLGKDMTAGDLALAEFFADLARKAPGEAAKTTPSGHPLEAPDILEALRDLPSGTVAIFTLVGEDRFRSILSTPNTQKSYDYPIRAADLNRKVLAFRQAAKDPKADPLPLAEELYKILLGPMAEDLRQAHAQTLMWSLDGVLRYLPLAALCDGKQYLIERYRVSVLTLASHTRLKERPNSKWTAAGFGVTKSYEGLPPLPLVSAELSSIIAPAPGAAGVLAGEIKLDSAFTRQAIRQALREHYPVVHIASHFRFEPGNETRSYLLLGDGSHLSLAELMTLPNLFRNVQLLTLSACNTGMGEGTEVEGFGTLAERQGAQAVIASLWPVADSSTKALMQQFYRIRESTPGMTKLEALRQAQLALLRGSAGRPLHAPRAPYAHPYYWAPFFLMGNWL